MKTYTILTLGCKVNQGESEAIACGLERDGWERAAGETAADLCIINTCAVTRKAAMQSRQAVRRARRTHPKARILVAGCYAETETEVILGMEEPDLIVGHADKHRIPEIVKDWSPAGPRPSVIRTRKALETTEFHVLPISSPGARTRPFLKIQDGCSAFCTYCIVPHARGPSRSMPEEAVLSALDGLASRGAREVVLSGVHLGCWGRDLRPETDLTTLLTEIVRRSRIDRVRLSSIEPPEVTDALIHLAAGTERICRHFHVPLQSGDDGILRRMNRPYTRDDFRHRIETILTRLPDAAVGVDVLVGFPGEDGQAAENTYGLLEELPIAYLHVFPFSPRDGTPAARFSGRIAQEVVKERCSRLRKLGGMKREAFYRRFSGRRLTVLVESARDPATGMLKGISSNYIPVVFPGDDALKNRWAAVTLTGVQGGNRVQGLMDPP